MEHERPRPKLIRVVFFVPIAVIKDIPASAYYTLDRVELLPYFPVWMYQKQGRAPEPLWTIQPDAQTIRYHWQNWDEPIFQPHPDDGGLRWDLLEWTDNP